MASREKKTKKSTGIRRATTAKAGKRSGPFIRPPRPTRSVIELDTRRLRRERGGMFGVAPVHVWNHLIIGTQNGRHKQTARELSAVAKYLRDQAKANVYEEAS